MKRNNWSNKTVLWSDLLSPRSKSPSTSSWARLPLDKKETTWLTVWVLLERTQVVVKVALEYLTRYIIIWTDRTKRRRNSRKENSEKRVGFCKVAALDCWATRSTSTAQWTRRRETTSSSRSIRTIRRWTRFKSWTCLSNHHTIDLVDRDHCLIQDLRKTKWYFQPRPRRFFREVSWRWCLELWWVHHRWRLLHRRSTLPARYH